MRINSVDSGFKNVQNVRDTQVEVNAVGIQSETFVNDDRRAEIKSDNSVSDATLENSIKQANKTLEQYNRKIERTVHEITHTIIYVLKDTVTDEVIKEFPSRKIQDMIAKMWEMAGLLVDERR